MKNKEEIYTITSIVLMIDQIIKLIIQKNMEIYQSIKIIPHFFSLYYVQNTGAAFSILKDSTLLLIVISAATIVLLNRYIIKEEHFTKLSKISLGLILGGIFGNLLDRIIHHAVIDYLSFTIFKYEFPVFNLADSAIVVGVILLLVEMIVEKKQKLEERGK